MSERLRMVSLMLGIAAVSAGVLGAGTPYAPCFQCQEDGSGSVHFCSSVECESGGENCFEGCDHLGPVQGGCFQFHDHCPGEDLDVEAIVSSVESQDRDEIEAILGAHSEWVKFNGTRGAIQVHGCGGEVTHHIPVDDALALALQATSE